MEDKDQCIRFTWDEDDVSRDSQSGGSILQTSMDDRDDSSNSVQAGEHSDQSPGSSRERLVLKLKRITDRYYVVENCGDSSYLNYSYLRTKFEEYEIPTGFQPFSGSGRNSPAKVHRCKTCRKVFNKVTALAAHRKTHTAGFDTSRRGFNAADFARRFSDLGSSRAGGDPNMLKPSEYEELLAKISPHPSTYPGYVDMKLHLLPHIVPDHNLVIGDDVFSVTDFVGEGGFARVFSANWDTGPPGQQDMVLKIQMPVNDWEWYCLNALHSRYQKLSHPLKDENRGWQGGFMSSVRCYSYRDGNILATEYQRMGTLLDLVNLTKAADKQIIEPLALHLMAELLGLMELVHSARIVHADIKPDNFLVRHTPATKAETSLQLIDFGKALDLSVSSDDGDSRETDTNTEGRTGKYHLDYFGIAGCAYCLLFGSYLEVTTAKDRWVIKGTLRRWWQVKMWNEFFDDMLNPKGEEKKCLPSLMKWREKFTKLLDQSEELRNGLNKAREVVDLKYMEKWRRSAI